VTPEGRIKAMTNRRLKALQRLYKFMPVQNGMGAPGLDYYLCAGGWFIAIETKAPGKKMTPRQEQTAAEITAAHGLVFVVDSRESLDVAMKTIAACCLLADEIRADPRDGGRPSV
jgi:hypothetical protein